MADLPLYSTELKRIRTEYSVSRARLATLAGVSEELIRLIELGQRAPSLSLLQTWLDQGGLSVEDRPDIASSVYARKLENKYGKVQLTSPAMEGLTEDLVGLVVEFAGTDKHSDLCTRRITTILRKYGIT